MEPGGVIYCGDRDPLIMVLIVPSAHKISTVCIVAQ